MKKFIVKYLQIFFYTFLLIIILLPARNLYSQSEICHPNGGHKDDENFIVGRITYDTSHAIHGVVKLLKVNMSNSDVIVVDSARVNPQGYYSIFGVPPGNYYIVAYPDDEIEDYMISFYPSGQIWSTASRIVITPGPGGVTTCNISTVRMYSTTGGTPVQGEVADSGNHNTKLKNSIITAKSGTQYRGFAITDNLGRYLVNSILPGSYNLTATRFGYRNQSQNFEITSSPAIINFYMARDTSFTIGVSNNSTVAKDFKLNQNYPNPFNPTTEITFTLDKAIDVKLSVYSIDGKFIKELVNGFRQAGDYRVSFNGENLSSGVYNYIMETGTGQRESRLMVFTK